MTAYLALTWYKVYSDQQPPVFAKDWLPKSSSNGVRYSVSTMEEWLSVEMLVQKKPAGMMDGHLITCVTHRLGALVGIICAVNLLFRS